MGLIYLMRNTCRSYSKILKKGNHFEDLDLNGRLIVKLEVLGRTTVYFSLIRHGPHRERRVYFDATTNVEFWSSQPHLSTWPSPGLLSSNLVPSPS
jgi:hypothetical protein